MATKFFNLDTDPTLSSNSDHLIASQKAIKTALGTKVDKTTTINGKSLSDNIELSATDVKALPDTTFIPTKVSEVENDTLYISENDLNTKSIVSNNNKIEAIATIEQNRSMPTSLWVGTLAEYEVAVENNLINDTTLCYITDDEDNGEEENPISSFVNNVITGIPQNVSPYLSISTTPTIQIGNYSKAWTNSNGETIYTIDTIAALPSEGSKKIKIYDENDTLISSDADVYNDGELYIIYNDVRYDINQSNENNSIIYTEELGTIKATLNMGAVVYIPNGTSYDRVAISEDVISDDYNQFGVEEKEFYIVYDNTNRKLHFIEKSNFTNVLSEPSYLVNGAWYDTLNKKIYLYENGSKKNYEISLPLGIVSAYKEMSSAPSMFPYYNSFSTITKVLQYFDAFGYIGLYSPITVFVLPGVSGIAANGRYVTTGYMNNIEFTITDVIVSNISGNDTYSLAFTTDNTIARYKSFKLDNDNYLYGDGVDIIYGVEFMRILISESQASIVDSFTSSTVQLAPTTLVDKKADVSDTLKGYGITDAYTKKEIDNMFGDIQSILDEINGESV
jgi:hypothetical protein